jgi:hypothetical protein
VLLWLENRSKKKKDGATGGDGSKKTEAVTAAG